MGTLWTSVLADEAMDEVITTSISEAPSLNLMLDVDSTEITPSPAATAAASTYCTASYSDPVLRMTSVMEFHKAKNAHAWWSYGKKADSTLETAIKTPSASAFKVSGSASISNTHSTRVFQDFEDSTARNAYARTNFRIARYRYVPIAGYSAPEGTQCYGMPSNIKVGTKVRVPSAFAGGVQMNSDLPGAEFIGCNNSNLRTPYPKGSGFERDSNKSAKITGAFEVAGLGLGAQSGFSDTVTLKYKSHVAPGIWVCGTSQLPTVAGVVHAQNR